MDISFWQGFLLGFAACFGGFAFLCFMVLRKFAVRHGSWLRSKNEGW